MKTKANQVAAKEPPGTAALASRWWVFALGFVAVVAVAAFFRLYRLHEFPPFFNFDEAAHATDAQLILSGHQFIFSPKIGGVEAFFMYVTAGAFALLGQTPYAQRLVSAVVGIVTVAVTCLWVRDMFGYRKSTRLGRAGLAGAGGLALVTGLGLATSFWHVNYSRIGLEVTMVPLCAVGSAYFLWRGLRTERTLDLVISGIWLGIGPYTHLPARFLPFPLGLFFLGRWLLALHSPERREAGFWTYTWRSFRPLVIVGLAALVVFAPLGYHFVRYPADFLGRASVTSIFNPAMNKGDFWGTLARSIIGTFGGFGFTSDSNWLANLPGKSILNPVLAVLFWLGVAVTLSRIRRLPYLFIFLWWFVLLVPPIITPERSPHFARMMGVAPVAYLFPAIGLWALGDLLAPLLEPGRTLWFTFADPELRFAIGYPEFLSPWQKLLSRAARVAPVCAVAVLFAGTAVSTYRDYFDVWAYSDQHYMAFDGYAVELTDEMMADRDPQSVYVLPRDIRAGEFFQHYTIDFLDRGGAPYHYIPMSEPNVPALLTQACQGKSNVHLVKWKMDKHREADPKDYVAWLLERFGRRVDTESFQAYDIVTYRLPSGNVDFTRPVAYTPVGADFGGRLTLSQAAYGNASASGLDTSPQAPSGGQVWIVLNWVKTAQFSDDYRVSLVLEDAQGHVIGHMDRDLLHNWHMRTGGWPLNETVGDYYLLPVPAGTPPAGYVIRVAVYAAATMERLPVAGGTASSSAMMGRIEISPPDESSSRQVRAPQTSVAEALGDGLNLLGFDLDLSRGYNPGDRVTLALLWQATARPEGDDRLTVEVRSAAPGLGGRTDEASDVPGRTASVLSPVRLAGDGYPTTRWSAGDVWRGLYDLSLPADLPAGQYDLWATLTGDDGQMLGGARLGQVSVAGRARQFDLPVGIGHPQSVDLGAGAVRFLGYDLDTESAKPGGALKLTLYWQAGTTMDVGYTEFVHLLDRDNRVRAQRDVVPGEGNAPTTGWLPGEIISDRLELPLGPDLSPATYTLEAGLYDPADGRRLAVAGSGDRILLGEVSVR